MQRQSHVESILAIKIAKQRLLCCGLYNSKNRSSANGSTNAPPRINTSSLFFYKKIYPLFRLLPITFPYHNPAFGQVAQKTFTQAKLGCCSDYQKAKNAILVKDYYNGLYGLLCETCVVEVLPQPEASHRQLNPTMLNASCYLNMAPIYSPHPFSGCDILLELAPRENKKTSDKKPTSKYQCNHYTNATDVIRQLTSIVLYNSAQILESLKVSSLCECRLSGCGVQIRGPTCCRDIKY